MDDAGRIREKSASAEDRQSQEGLVSFLESPASYPHGSPEVRSIQTHIGWCAKEAVPRAIITHCASEIVTDERKLAAKLRTVGIERGLASRLAHNGMELVL